MKLPFISKNKEGNRTWQWRLCGHTKTLSFRAGEEIFKTVNSVFFDDKDAFAIPESWFTNLTESVSHTTEDESDEPSFDSATIRGFRSERLFFEPGDTRSILKDLRTDGFPFKESCVALAMESADPYRDFRRSMEEMVESHGLRDWECMGELLGWYLKMNGKINHGFIVGAFVDLLIGITAVPKSSDSTSYLSAASSFSSLSSPPVLGQIEIIDEETKHYHQLENVN